MKKIIYWLFMLPLFALLNGCDDTDTIIFDDELPQFEIKANAILLEVIMPKVLPMTNTTLWATSTEEPKLL